jgi:hypothetical protein
VLRVRLSGGSHWLVGGPLGGECVSACIGLWVGGVWGGDVSGWEGEPPARARVCAGCFDWRAPPCRQYAVITSDRTVVERQNLVAQQN